ncbi:MAG: ribosome maturation factor RimP [Gammaproteobacteria bacterium]|nr:ribosome maturation factor RimP [Gammaproteobacteria bacterium]
MALRDQMIELLEPTVEAMGYELVEVECSTNPKNGLLRLYIDGPDGIGLEDCEKVSHQVSGVLDVEDPMPGEYSLEVSSPGLDRPLRTGAHFEAVIGQRVKLELDKPENGRWRFTGELKGFANDVLTVDVDGEEVNVEAAALKKARLVPEF